MSSASSTASASASDAVAVDDVSWVLPKDASSLLHMYTDEAETGPVPVCRKSPFGWGYQVGVGLASADDTGRRWCSKCSSHLPLRTD